MIPADPFNELLNASTLQGRPVKKSDLDKFSRIIGRAIPADIHRLWSMVNGCHLDHYRIYGINPSHEHLIDASDVLRDFVQWQALGWIPLASDAFGNQFVSIPTPTGEVVGFVDLGFDPIDVVLCVAGSSTSRFIEHLLLLDRGGKDNPDRDPCLMAIADPDLPKAESAVLKWLKYKK